MKKLFYSILLICAASITMAGSIQACCIYNNTKYPLQVDKTLFGTGPVVAPSNKYCTDGDSVSAFFYLLDGLRKDRISTMSHQKVDDHGWLSVYKKENGKWRVVNKHKDGTIKSTTFIEPNDGDSQVCK